MSYILQYEYSITTPPHHLYQQKVCGYGYAIVTTKTNNTQIGLQEVSHVCTSIGDVSKFQTHFPLLHNRTLTTPPRSDEATYLSS